MKKSVLRMEMGGGSNGRIRININRRACTHTKGQVTKKVSSLQPPNELNRLLNLLHFCGGVRRVDDFVGDHGQVLVWFYMGLRERYFVRPAKIDYRAKGQRPCLAWENAADFLEIFFLRCWFSIILD